MLGRGKERELEHESTIQKERRTISKESRNDYTVAQYHPPADLWLKLRFLHFTFTHIYFSEPSLSYCIFSQNMPTSHFILGKLVIVLSKTSFLYPDGLVS